MDEGHINCLILGLVFAFSCLCGYGVHSWSFWCPEIPKCPKCPVCPKCPECPVCPECPEPSCFPSMVNIWIESVINGQDVQASCYVKSVSDPMEISSIQFYKDDDLFDSGKENVGGRWLSMLQLKKSDVKEGNYICQATTTNNFIMRTSFSLSDLVENESKDLLDTEFDLRTSFRWGCPPQALDSKCALDRIKDIEDWLKNTNCIMLVTGKTGTGKTTLIRGITQEFKPPENTLLPHTKVVTPYAYVHDGAKCTFYDTPGLKDNEENSNDYNYLKQMVQDPDVLIFAVKMTDYSLQEEDKHTIANVTEAYGWKVWRKAVFILTFANLVSKVGAAEKGIDNRIKFREIETRFIHDIVKVLRETKVEEDSLDQLDFVPVGLVSNPYIDGQDDNQSWIDRFWSAINKVLSTSLKNRNNSFKKRT